MCGQNLYHLWDVWNFFTKVFSVNVSYLSGIKSPYHNTNSYLQNELELLGMENYVSFSFVFVFVAVTG